MSLRYLGLLCNKTQIYFFDCQTKTQLSDKKRNFESSSLRVKLFFFGLSGITHNVQIYIIHGFCIASLGKLMHGAFSAEKMNKLSIPYACSFFECQTKTQLSDKKRNFECSTLRVNLFVFRLSDIKRNFQIYASKGSVSLLFANSCMESSQQRTLLPCRR